MKLFQVVQEKFAFLGICAKQSLSNNVKSVMVFVIVGLGTAVGIVFLLFKANTFLEYTMNIYITTTLFGVWIEFIAIIFQKKNLFKLIDEIEEFYHKSKY